MRLFRVICLHVMSKHSRLFNANDIMTENDIISGHADQLVASEHVVEVTPEEAKGFGYIMPDDGSFEHILTADDIVNNPDADLIEGETITVPSKEDSDKAIAERIAELEVDIVKAKATKKPAKVAAAEKALADFKAGLN